MDYKKLYEEKVKECEDLKRELRKIKRGRKCSSNGQKYEFRVHDVVKNCSLGDQKFNTQNRKDLGGSTPSNDIECNFLQNRDIPIEIKKCGTPDWMQCSISFDSKLKAWKGSVNSKIPSKCKEIFEEHINKINLYNGEIPPFIKRKMTYNEWGKIKEQKAKWNDVYIDVPKDTIQNLYREKGCKYIQISEYGLYHLGKDICNFGVPEFLIEQQIRIRIKVHRREDAKGYCSLSITAACQPKNIRKLEKSPFSLDDEKDLPFNLKIR